MSFAEDGDTKRTTKHLDLKPTDYDVDKNLMLQRHPCLALGDIRNVVDWRLDNNQKLILLTIKEIVKAPDEDIREEINQYRILRPGSYEVWQETEGDYRLIESGQTSLDYIPI